MTFQAKYNSMIESREPGTPTPALLKGGEEKSPYALMLTRCRKWCLTLTLRLPYACLTTK